MSARRIVTAAGALVLVGLLAIGLVELATRSRGAAAPRVRLTAAQMQAQLAGAPAPLAALHAQASELLGGGPRALRARLAVLRGWPIVINKWASWCEPCKEEFGAFQRVSLNLGRRVAFIGIDSGDSARADPLRFLRSFPLSYPSYYDASGQLGVEATDSTNTPVTVFYDRDGGKYIHQGAFPSTAKLEYDVKRYAVGA
ncbi:MAG TPA: TlpA disulfide reductase family protein [Solirubrobacteraceae bacterium]|jgi:thiol-disulfide isomerase/thioredoxin